MKLNAKAIEVIETWRMGFVATVSAEGKPNVSPKATFIVVDDETIAFGEIRSPQTMANLAHQREVEVSFVDTLARSGVRVRGDAEIIEKGEEFDRLIPRFREIWGDLVDQFNAIIMVPCDAVKPLRSPAYEFGATEAELRAQWKQKIMDLPG